MKYNLLFLLIIWSLSFSVHAVQFTVAPVKLKLFPEQKSTVLKLINRDAQTTKVQVYVRAWSQDETGSDIHQETSELIVYPKILTIEGHQERSLRVGFQGKWPPQTEQAYRIYVEELRIKDSRESQGVSTGITMLLHMSIPAFVMPNQTVFPPQFEIEHIEKRDAVLKVGVRNTGDYHFKVSNLEVNWLDKNGSKLSSQSTQGWYVLPHQRVFFDIPLEKAACLATQAAQINVSVNEQLQTKQVQLPSGHCSSKQK
jgi:fimbrial chaperone protein